MIVRYQLNKGMTPSLCDSMFHRNLFKRGLDLQQPAENPRWWRRRGLEAVELAETV